MTARGLAVEKAPRPEGPTVRDAVMSLLRDLGMTTLFGNPGSTELPLFRDMPQDFRYILGLQESVVVGMADGFAQMSGNAAFVNLHSSAGTGHALGNIFTAFRNQTPMVITAGQQARSIFPYDPFLYAERATEFPQPFVKWTCEPARAEDVPLAILRAYHMAMQAPRGPVFVSVPIDDWDRPCAPIAPSVVSQAQSVPAHEIAALAKALEVATSPVIVAGAGVGREDARAALVDLAQTQQAPVWVAPMAGREVFPEDHPLFAGFLPASREAIVSMLVGHDVVLVLGAPAFTYHVEGHGPYLPDGAQLIQIVDDPSVAARTPVGRALVGNVHDAIVQLQAAAKPAARRAPVIPPPHADPLPLGPAISEALLMQRLHVLRPKGLLISEEAPSTRGPLHDYFPIRLDDKFMATASGGLGFALPAAVGAALARPDKMVFCLLGDGSSMYSIQGLWTAADMKLDVRFLIVNNGGYAALDQFGALFDIDVVGSKLPGLDFVLIAQGMSLWTPMGHNWTHFWFPDVLAATAWQRVAEGTNLRRLLEPHIRFANRHNHAGLWVQRATDNNPSVGKKLVPWLVFPMYSLPMRAVFTGGAKDFHASHDIFTFADTADRRIPYFDYLGQHHAVVARFVDRVLPSLEADALTAWQAEVARWFPRAAEVTPAVLLTTALWLIGVAHATEHLTYVDWSRRFGHADVATPIAAPGGGTANGYDRYRFLAFVNNFVDFRPPTTGLDLRLVTSDEAYGFAPGSDAAQAATAFVSELRALNAQLQGKPGGILDLDRLIRCICF